MVQSGPGGRTVADLVAFSQSFAVAVRYDSSPIQRSSGTRSFGSHCLG